MKNLIATVAIIFTAILIGGAQSAFAGDDPPSNDILSSAWPVVMSNGLGDVTAGNIHATKEAEEPNHAGNPGGRSVWFKITPTATSVYRISTIENGFDTLLAVYTGSSMGNLTPIVFNDDCHDQCGGGSTVDIMVTEGTTYYIAIDGYNDAGTIGEGTFRMTILDNGAPFTDNLLGAYNLQNANWGSIGGTNYNATREATEPQHSGSGFPGDKSVWYRWLAPDSMGMYIDLSETFGSQIAVYRSSTPTPTYANLTKVGANVDQNADSYSKYRARFFAQQGFYYFIMIGTHNMQSGNFQLTWGIAAMKYSTDYELADNKASLATFRPSEGTWHRRTNIYGNGHVAFKWGLNGDVPISADFTGEGITEHAVVRNENGLKIWYIATPSQATIIQWGLASDKPIVGDFDGDARADMAVIRNTAQGFVWYVRQSSTGSLRTFTFGTTGDRPVLGDFDGDRFTDVAVVRNTANGLVWYILYSAGNLQSLPYTIVRVQQFGMAPDVPAVEDFDGDGKTDITVFRPSNGVWYILQSGNGQVRSDAFGLNGDKPQPADYNGDGKADLAVFRPSNGAWYVASPFGVPAQNFETILFGLGTDIPVSSLVTLSQ